MLYGKRPRGKGIFKKGETEMSFKELLKSKDMTAARLSRKIGVTKETVGNWVHGRNIPKNVLTIVLFSSFGMIVLYVFPTEQK